MKNMILQWSSQDDTLKMTRELTESQIMGLKYDLKLEFSYSLIWDLHEGLAAPSESSSLEFFSPKTEFGFEKVSRSSMQEILEWDQMQTVELELEIPEIGKGASCAITWWEGRENS